MRQLRTRPGSPPGAQDIAETRFVCSPQIALPGTRPSRCLHTNQVATEKALLGICHMNIAGAKSAGVTGLEVSGCGDRVGTFGSGGRNSVGLTLSDSEDHGGGPV